MEAWFARLRDLGSPGCHLGVIAENQRAVAFFRAMGFEPHGEPLPNPGMRGRSGERLHQQMMVRPAKASPLDVPSYASAFHRKCASEIATRIAPRSRRTAP